jgi:hypothetical protein
MWDVIVTDGLGCFGETAGSFRVTDNLGVPISGIDPPFGYTASTTAVRISAPSPGRFELGIRAYLSPADGGVATSIAALDFVRANELTGVVPAGLSPATYDLIVVNPGGTVGILEDAYTTLADPVPVITAISPQSVPTNSTQRITATGTGFADGATASLFCSDNGTLSFFEATTVSVTPTTVIFDIAAGVGAGNVCVVRVTNADGGYGNFSALAFTNPAENIAPFRDERSLNAARTRAGVSPGRATLSSRFVYVAGGTGTTGPLDSVEAGGLDAFGEIVQWRTLPTRLPNPRTNARMVTVGRFVYLVGGEVEGTPTTSVLRAQILSPDDSPEIGEVSIGLTEDGVGAGVWYYRVAAVLNEGDSSNPGGVTLASETQPIRVPVTLADGVSISIGWTPVPNAAAYRIYRTTAPNQTSANQRLLAVVPGTSTTFVDDGSIVQSPTAALPRQIGDLGEWHQVVSLNTPRAGFGIAVAADPVTANRWYIYALGGLRSAGNLLASYEFLAIDVLANGTQTVGSWTTGNASLSSARHDLGAYTVDQSVSRNIADATSYVFAAGGRGTGGSISTNVDAGRVLAGGSLGALTTERSMSPNYAGYVALAAANQLWAFGGQNGNANNSVISTQVCQNAGDCTGLSNWNNTGISLSLARIYAGGALESGRMFIVGGSTGAGTPTASVESTIW